MFMFYENRLTNSYRFKIIGIGSLFILIHKKSTNKKMLIAIFQAISIQLY